MILALAAVALAVGRPLAAVAAAVVLPAVARGGPVAGLGAAGVVGALALARHEASTRRRRQTERELARQVLEALVEAATVEADVTTALHRALERLHPESLVPLRRALAAGLAPEAAVQRHAPHALRPLAATLAFCRRSGTRLGLAAALTRDELVQRWQIAEEAESGVVLLRAVTTALAVVVTGLLLTLATATPFSRLPGAGTVAVFAFGSCAVAVLLPRAWNTP